MQAFNRVALIGVGLINGSLAKVLKRQKLATCISGYARRQETRERALEIGLIDEAASNLKEAVKDADLIVLGTPPGAMAAIAKEMGPFLSRSAIVTDVGSIKVRVIEDVIPHLPNPSMFVPAHPIAGTEHSGPDAAFDTLFVNRRCVLTPLDHTDQSAITTIRKLWELAGSEVDLMDPVHHDKILAITSHLPHLIAFSIVGTVSDLEGQTRSEVFKFAAGGFTDFTRIAGSDPTMWRDIFLNNKEAVLEMLQRFQEDLVLLQRSIRWDEGDTLFELFTRTRTIRRGVIEAGQAYVRQPEDPMAEKS